MKILPFSLLAFVFLFGSCGEEEPEPEPEPEIVNLVTVQINGKDYKAEAGNASPQIINGNYRIETDDLPRQLYIIFNGPPEVKSYTLNGDLEESGALIRLRTNYENQDSDHIMRSGTLNVTSWENKELKGNFGGEVTQVVPPEAKLQLGRGAFHVKFP